MMTAFIHSVAMLVFLGGTTDPVETKMVQVHPEFKEGMKRTTAQNRAVMLIAGIKLHPINGAKAAEAIIHDWQKPASPLVKAVGKDADVFAYAYGQTASLETIAEAPAMKRAIAKLKFMGYTEIILVGHSAGGVLARLFVEDHPDSGVTKVIQVCSPNDGSSLAKANFGVRKEQEAFLQSLTKQERCKQSLLREDKRIPDKVEFCCLVGVAGTYGDGVVAGPSQWPPDLQKQGIPAIRLNTAHFTVMRAPQTIDKIGVLIREPQARWTQEKVESMRKSILGELKK